MNSVGCGVRVFEQDTVNLCNSAAAPAAAAPAVAVAPSSCGCASATSPLRVDWRSWKTWAVIGAAVYLIRRR